MSKNDGGPAFPAFDIDRQPDPYKSAVSPGMSLRDWFAGQALAGFLAGDGGLQRPAKDVAGWAYNYADAMLRARQSQEGEDA